MQDGTTGDEEAGQGVQENAQDRHVAIERKKETAEQQERRWKYPLTVSFLRSKIFFVTTHVCHPNTDSSSNTSANYFGIASIQLMVDQSDILRPIAPAIRIFFIFFEYISQLLWHNIHSTRGRPVRHSSTECSCYSNVQAIPRHTPRKQKKQHVVCW